MQIDIDRLARTTPIWVSPLVLAGVVVPPLIVLGALWHGNPDTALAVFLAVAISNLGSSLARKYTECTDLIILCRRYDYSPGPPPGRGFLLPGNHWIILERLCYNRPSSSFVRKAAGMVNEADLVAALVAKLEPFETLVFEAGRIWGQRAYKEASLEDTQRRIATRWTPQHRLEVTRYAEGYKLTVLRSLLT